MKQYTVEWSIKATTKVYANNDVEAREAVHDYFENRNLEGDGRQSSTIETMSINSIQGAQ